MDATFSISRFKDLFNDRLNEATWKNLRRAGVDMVPDKRIIDAITNRKQVDLTYVDPDGIRTHRNVEIYAYGISRALKPIIRVFQTWGNSSSMGRNEKGWRTLRVDRIARMRVLKTFSSFDSNPKSRFAVPGYKMNDKDMIYIFKQVNFNEKPRQPQVATQEPEEQQSITPRVISSTETHETQAVDKPVQQTQSEPVVNQPAIDQMVMQGTEKIPQQNGVDTEPGNAFSKEFNDKISIIKDKLETDAANATGEDEEGDTP